MRALSIRQPYAELILRGIKTIEYRSRPTRIIGERFYIYAARTPGPREAWAELDFEPSDPGAPTGVIVGSTTITRCTVVRASRPNGNGTRAGSPCHRHYQWHLSDVKRLKRPRKPKRMPRLVRRRRTSSCGGGGRRCVAPGWRGGRSRYEAFVSCG